MQDVYGADDLAIYDEAHRLKDVRELVAVNVFVDPALAAQHPVSDGLDGLVEGHLMHLPLVINNRPARSVVHPGGLDLGCVLVKNAVRFQDVAF